MIKFTTKKKGDIGEDYVVKFLLKKKYKILERNFRKPFGEIDIIAENKEYIVFVEVKTRHQNSISSGAEAVDYSKQRKIIKTAMAYIAEKDIEKYCRFDVCEVCVDRDSYSLLNINYIENAFQSEG